MGMEIVMTMGLICSRGGFWASCLGKYTVIGLEVILSLVAYYQLYDIIERSVRT
jgi:hypothetical protein